MRRSQFLLEEKVILRDFLALERTRLANERTLLAYVRTSLYFLLGGIAFLQIEGIGNLDWIGYLFLITSAALLLAGLIRFLVLRGRLKQYYLAGDKSPDKSV